MNKQTQACIEAIDSREAIALERLNALVNAAASKILEGRDQARKEMAIADAAAIKTIDKLKAAAAAYQAPVVDMAGLVSLGQEVRAQIDGLQAQLAGMRRDVNIVSDYIGQVVCLKSDQDHKMTVASLDSDGLICVWFNNGELIDASIPINALQLVNQPVRAKSPTTKAKAAQS